MEITSYSLTDIGRRREQNEDRVKIVEPENPDVKAELGCLYIVADGMGGHEAGELASQMAVDLISQCYYSMKSLVNQKQANPSSSVSSSFASPLRSQPPSSSIEENLRKSVIYANESIHNESKDSMSGIGTTVTLALVKDDKAYIANVGDSRTYLFRDGYLTQITVDHSWVEEQVAHGIITAEQAETHIHKNIVTRSLGIQPDVQVDIFSTDLLPGDRLLLCSDGLTTPVRDIEIAQILEYSRTPQEACEKLIDIANKKGGPDNISVIVVQLTAPPHESSKKKTDTQPQPIFCARRRGERKLLKRIINKLITILIILLAISIIILGIRFLIRRWELVKPGDPEAQASPGERATAAVPWELSGLLHPAFRLPFRFATAKGVRSELISLS